MSDTGEFARIRAIVAQLGSAASAGIGDDCAVLPEGPGRLVISTDMAVEGVHFKTEWLTLEEIGWRAAAGALSDLAAMGAETVGVLASVASPPNASPDAVTRVMAGVGAAVHAAGGVVLGGDLSRAPQWLVDITVVGRTLRPVLRSGAQGGNSIWVTGQLGGARAALQAWQRGEEPSTDARIAFAHPSPRIGIGRVLADAGATAMIDLSDGLAGDAAHLAAASNVGLVIKLEQLPLHPAVATAAGRAGQPDAIFGALGGEDYELLLTTPASIGLEWMGRIAAETGVSCTRIGMVTEGQEVRLLLGGKPQALTGFDHFA